MNIIFAKKYNNKTIVSYTYCWLIVSSVVSAIFSFYLFPKMYAIRSNSTVLVWFCAKHKVDGLEFNVYYPNTEIYRSKHLMNLADRTFLYFSKCELLPLSQRAKCDDTNNWTKIDPRELNYSNVESCTKTTYTISETQRQSHLSGINFKEGNIASVADLPGQSLSDPIWWGFSARWPLFFVCLFLFLKLGRTLGEFIFTPYHTKTQEADDIIDLNQLGEKTEK